MGLLDSLIGVGRTGSWGSPGDNYGQWSQNQVDEDLLRQIPPAQPLWRPRPQDLATEAHAKRMEEMQRDLEGLRGDNLQRAHEMLRERELRFKQNQEMRMRNQRLDQYRQYPGKGQPSPWVSEEANSLLPGAVLDAVRGGQWQPQYGPPGVY